MKVNLKKFSLEKESLKYIQKRLSEQQSTKSFANKLAKTIKLMDEIELDLELSGESIICLDKERLDSIEERNKMLLLLNEADNDI